MKILKKRVKKIVAVSDEVGFFINKKLDISSKVIPTPVAIYGTSTSKRENRVVLLGRLNEQKAPLLALKAFEVALQKDLLPKEAKLMIIGDGPSLGDLKLYTLQANITESVEFLGQIKPDRVRDLLSTSKCLISTSIYEGNPLARLEALAAGCCIVSTPTGGLSQFTDLLKSPTGGFFVSTYDAESFGEFLSESFMDKYWTYESISSRVNSVSDFHPRNIALQYLSII
jgi:glycosyltransferase involved in cell wall biosynthesis